MINMDSLHSNSVISELYDIPVLSRPVKPPYGLMFGECKAGSSIPFHKDVPFHLLFLLKGAARVKAGGKEIDIFQNEFLMVDSTLPVECVSAHRSHYLIICLEKASPTDTDSCTDWKAVQTRPIHAELSVLLRYMMATMPLGEKINHYLIPRIIRFLMCRYNVSC